MAVYVGPVSGKRKSRQEFSWHRNRKEGGKEPTDGYLRGVESEARFLSICDAFRTDGKFPGWLVAVVRGTREQDGQGIDFVAHTTDGYEIYIQIKSSLMGRTFFLAKPRNVHIICIVIEASLEDEAIFRLMVAEVAHFREAFLLRDGNDGR